MCVYFVFRFFRISISEHEGESITPAPTAEGDSRDVDAGGIDNLSFEDAGWEMNVGEAAALAALGLLSALTFFPLCSK